MCTKAPFFLVFALLIFPFVGAAQVSAEDSGEAEDGMNLSLGTEEECPSGEWWHVGGQRCVPIFCVGGNQLRDLETGKCLIGKRFSHSTALAKGAMMGRRPGRGSRSRGIGGGGGGRNVLRVLG